MSAAAPAPPRGGIRTLGRPGNARRSRSSHSASHLSRGSHAPCLRPLIGWGRAAECAHWPAPRAGGTGCALYVLIDQSRSHFPPSRAVLPAALSDTFVPRGDAAARGIVFDSLPCRLFQPYTPSLATCRRRHDHRGLRQRYASRRGEWRGLGRRASCGWQRRHGVWMVAEGEEEEEVGGGRRGGGGGNTASPEWGRTHGGQ